MKILHLYWDFEIGGIQTLISLIANNQCIKHEVSVLFLSEKNKTSIDLFNSKVNVAYLNKDGSIPKKLFVLLKLNLYLLTHKFDVIHVHAPELIKYVIPFIKGNFIGTYHRDKNFFNTKRYYCTTSVSKHVHNCLKEALNIDSEIVENGIAVEKYKTKSSKKSDVFKIVQVGRLEHHQKAQDFTIKVIKRLKDAGYRVSLDLIGTGPSLNYLEKLVNEFNLCSEIHFLGLKKQNYLYENLCNYDLLLQPSTYEAFGLTVIEAMAAKVPVVVSDVSALRSIVDNGNCGDIFKIEDENDCLEVLKKIINNGPSEKKIKSAFSRAISNYSVDSMCEHYMNVYRNICNRDR